jgi:regulator of sigma E protease
MEFILNMLSYVGWVLLAIMILVFVHEMGHFLLAKLFKMRVERFSIGFPPKIIGFQKGETEYVLGLTPLGGYVKISGMVDESMDTDQLQNEPEPWEFRAKPVWQRILVITAGVVFNMILAAVIFIGLKAVYGESYIPPVGQVYVADSSLAQNIGLRTGDEILTVNGKRLKRFDREGLEAVLTGRLEIVVERDGERMTFYGPEDIMTQISRTNQAGGFMGISFDPAIVGQLVDDAPAASVGLMPGDRILAINDQPIRFWSEMTEQIQKSEGAPLLIRWERPDSLAAARPGGAESVQRGVHGGAVYEAELLPSQEGDRYVVGIYPYREYIDYNVATATVAGVADTWLNTKLIATSLKRLFSGKENFRENVGGPIMIAKYTKEAADAGWPFFWNIVAVLSITLAIINILPIPALDGGHLVFLLYEGITRREPSLKVRMVLQQIGMIVLLVFMTFLIFNDILRL